MYIVDECMRTMPGGFYHQKMNRYQKPFNKAILGLKEGGIIEKIISKYTDASIAKTPPKSNLQVLTVGHFETPMYLVLTMWSLNIIFFAFEILFKGKRNSLNQ